MQIFPPDFTVLRCQARQSLSRLMWRIVAWTVNAHVLNVFVYFRFDGFDAAWGVEIDRIFSCMYMQVLVGVIFEVEVVLRHRFWQLFQFLAAQNRSIDRPAFRNGLFRVSTTSKDK